MPSTPQMPASQEDATTDLSPPKTPVVRYVFTTLCGMMIGIVTSALCYLAVGNRYQLHATESDTFRIDTWTGTTYILSTYQFSNKKQWQPVLEP